MTISQWIKNKILKWLGFEHTQNNPNSERLTYINDDEMIYQNGIRENKMWYIGNASELLNYFTNRQIYGTYRNAIYDRNERQLFWGLSTMECNIKRIHSGVPRAIVTVLTNALGCPEITISDENAISTDAIEKQKELNEKLQEILKWNDFKNLYNQKQVPMTLVTGDGAYKIDVVKGLKHPVIQFYDAEDVDFVEDYGRITAVVFKDYYKDDKGRDYVKLETRGIKGEDAIVEHHLFKLSKNNELAEVSLSTIPELEGLEDQTIPGLGRMLAVPCKFFYNPIYTKRGRSFFEGKQELFDFLDEIISQFSQTNRVSTPVEYYSVDILERSNNGVMVRPNLYNRQFVQKQGVPDGDGITGGKDIETTQPQLNFTQYQEAYKSVLDMILVGDMSPTTMGFNVAKKDNADAQREKEKVTIMTRNNIMDRETDICKELAEICLMLQEYIDSGEISVKDYEVSVKFDEFANPSFEQEIGVLGAARAGGNISTEKYVELLWGDKLSPEDKQKEIDYIESRNSQDTFSFGNMGLEDVSENTNKEDISESESEE